MRNRSIPAAALGAALPWRRGGTLLGCFFAAALIAGCDDIRDPVAPAVSSARSVADAPSNDVITTSPQELAEALRRIGNTGGSDFELRLDLTDAAGATKTTYKYVTVSQCSGTELDCAV